MGRRIDALYCSSATAQETIMAICAEIESRAVEAHKEVNDAFEERMAAMQSRRADLLSQIDEVKNMKKRVLEEQLQEIQAGECPPAAPEDEDAEPNPDCFLLRADTVINFKKGLPISEKGDDFLEAIPKFGLIDDFSTYASNSYSKGPALGILKVARPSWVLIFACDRTGARRTEGGDTVAVEFSDPDVFEDLKVEDLKDGRYKATFVPIKEGNFSMNICIGSAESQEPIRGAPFELAVRMPMEYQKLGPDKARIGETGEPCKEDGLGMVHHPTGMTYNDSGRYVFVVDQSNHRVQVFDIMNSAPVTSYGTKGFAAHQFHSPCDVCIDRDNRVVVSDMLNHRLQVFEFTPKTQELRHVKTFGGKGAEAGQFLFPKGLTMDEDGKLLVCDSGNHRVQIFDMNNSMAFVKCLGTTGVQGMENGQFFSPLDIACDCDGNILVADKNHRIQVFDPEGSFKFVFGQKGRKDGCFNYPANITVSDENKLYVSDQGNARVQVLDASDGTFIHKWGGYRQKPASGEEGEAPPAEEEEGQPLPWIGLKSPTGIAVNAEGTVLVSDYHWSEIFVF
jgi:DNA-binding beta-propeller fold protein YncE